MEVKINKCDQILIEFDNKIGKSEHLHCTTSKTNSQEEMKQNKRKRNSYSGSESSNGSPHKKHKSPLTYNPKPKPSKTILQQTDLLQQLSDLKQQVTFSLSKLAWYLSFF